MSVYLTNSEITLEAMRVLKNNLVAAKQCNREYDKKFGVEGAKIGNVVNARKPVRYVGGEGAAIGNSIEDTIETSVPVTLNRQSNVSLQFTAADLLLSMDDFSRRFITPAAANLANKIDLAVLGLYKQVPYFVGTPGTVPQDLDIYLNAGASLDNNAAPADEQRAMIVNPNMQAKIVFALKGLFQSSEKIAQQYEKGKMGIAAGFNWMTDQNVWTHTVGTISGTPTFTSGGAPLVVAGVGGGVDYMNGSVVTAAWGNGTTTLKQGDVISFAKTNLVNPQNRQSIGSLAPFVVTADVSDDGSGNITIPISPAIIPSGPFQNVDAVPTSGDGVLVFGVASTGFAAITGKATGQGIAMHRDAFTLVCADLPMPRGVDMGARVADEDLGISIRLVRQYDVMTDKLVTRLDVLYGIACLRQELAVRVLSA